MLTWKEGPRELGCTWHKVAWFHLAGADGHIDVFVLPRIADARPIAVTLKVTPKGGAEDEVKEALANPADTHHLHAALVPALERAGFKPGMANTFVDDIVALVTDEADAIRAATAPTAR